MLLLCYSYFLGPNISDEIWNYGFSYNISRGMVIYRDFNVLQTPIFFFIGSLFIDIFGHHLWSAHILNSIILFGVFFILYKDIGKKFFIMVPIILFFCLYSYSLLCILLMFFLLYINNIDIKNKDLFIDIIVGIMFMTKQHVGICLFFPMIFYSNNKIKSFVLFMIPFILVSIYFLLNNAFYDFFDCCFLGMLDFGNNNTVYTIFTLFFVLEILYLIYRMIKYKDSNAFYIIAFHSIGIPIFDLYHYYLCVIFVIYYFLINYKLENYKYKYFFIISCFVYFCLMKYSFKGVSICTDSKSFMYGRNINNKYFNRIGNLYEYLTSSVFDKYGENIFILSNNAYFIKLNLGMSINNFDLILDGNMGYNGDVKRIKKMKSICESSDCLFILDKDIVGVQLNLNIRNYVIDNYSYVKDLDYYLVYDNEKE